MTLENNQIDIHESVNRQDRNWIKKQIAEVYANSNADLNNLKNSIISTQNADDIMEKKFTMDHVKKVLTDTVSLISKEGHANTFEKQGAGLTLSLQIALKKLGYNPGIIDGVYMKGTDQTAGRAASTKEEKEAIYGKSNTRKAVKAFQEQWNKDNPKDTLVVDGRAGKETLTKILQKLNNQPIVTGIDANPKVKLTDKLKESEKLLAEIGTQYLLPKGNRTAEKIDKTSTTPSKVILKSNIGGKTIEIELDETNEDLSGFNPNFRPDFGLNMRYNNPTLISGQDSFELQEKTLGKGPTAKTIITLVPKKEEVTKPVKKTEKTVIVPTTPEREQEEIETGNLTGNELANENYNELKDKLAGINGEELNFLDNYIKNLQEQTKTKLFCFESTTETQSIVRKMLSPMLLSTGDLPSSTINDLIQNPENYESASAAYTIKDIATTLNLILDDKANNRDLSKYGNTEFFIKFCKYLQETGIIAFDATTKKYIDNGTDQTSFINVLFAKTSNQENAQSVKINIKKGSETKEVYCNDALHELRHAEFNASIIDNPTNLQELKTYFYSPDTLKFEKTKQFLKYIYLTAGYTRHFQEGEADKENFINSLTPDKLKNKLKTEAYPAGNIPEKVLLDEFWAYTHDNDTSVPDITDHKFSWEEGYVAPVETPETDPSAEILSEINTRYEIAGNNNSNIQELKAERTSIGNSNTIKLTGKIGNQDVSILFDEQGTNPRLVRGDETLNLYEIPLSNSNKTKIVVVPDSAVIVENFLSYRDNLSIEGRSEQLSGGKFDFSDPQKIAIVFKDGTNEIRIVFDNNGNLVETDKNNIKIDSSADTYTASVENGNQPAKIVLTKNAAVVTNSETVIENNQNEIIQKYVPLISQYKGKTLTGPSAEKLQNKYNNNVLFLEQVPQLLFEYKNKFGSRTEKFAIFENKINDYVESVKNDFNKINNLTKDTNYQTTGQDVIYNKETAYAVVKKEFDKIGKETGLITMQDVFDMETE